MPPRPKETATTGWHEVHEALEQTVSAGGKTAPGCRLAIDGKWYNLDSWSAHHPGGAEVLRLFNGKDASDAFHSLHSDEAHARLTRMHREPVRSTDAIASQKPTAVALAYREFRSQLVKEGWFNREWMSEVWQNAVIYIMIVSGTVLAYSHPLTAIVLIVRRRACVVVVLNCTSNTH